MNSLSSLFRHRLPLLLILVVAGLLRLPGVTYGIPYIYEWDEPSVMNAVIGMLQRGDLSPRFYIYPPFSLYLQLLVAKLHFGVLHAQGVLGSPAAISTVPPDGTSYFWYISVPTFYVWGRTLALLFSVGSVYLVYRIGQRAFGETQGIIAAAALAVAPGAVYYGSTLRTDSPMTFMVLVAFAFGLAVLDEGRAPHYLLGGLFAGLAVATKYSGFWIIPTVFAAHFISRHRKPLDRRVLLLCVGIVVGIVAGFPELVLRTGPVLDELRAARFFRPGQLLGTLVPYWRYLSEGRDGFWFVPRHAGFGFFSTIFALAGAAVGWWLRWRPCALLLSFLLPYLITVTTQAYVSYQYIVPALPFLALLMGVAVVEGTSRLSDALGRPQARTLLMFTVAFVGLAESAQESVHLVSRLRVPDSRVEASRWVRSHATPGSVVAVARDLHWFLPSLESLRPVVATREDERLGWLLQHHVDYFVAPVGRDPFPQLPRLVTFPGVPQMAPPPDSPPNLVPLISPALTVIDTRGVLPVEELLQFPKRIASAEMISEPATSPTPGTVTGRIHLPRMRLSPGRYQLSVLAGWQVPAWIPPVTSPSYRIQVRVGGRVMEGVTVDPSHPRSVLRPVFEVTSTQVVPITLVVEMRGSVGALSPTRDLCAVVPDAPSLNAPDFTLEAWIYMRDLHRTTLVNEEREARIISKNAERGYALRIEGQRDRPSWKLELGLASRWSAVRGGAGIASLGPEGVISMGQWIHVAATADGRAGRLYINGEPVNLTFSDNPTGEYRGVPQTAGSPLLVGCHTGHDAWFDGLIAALRIWNYARSPEQIRQGLTARSTSRQPGLVASWSFDSVTADGRILDASGAGNHISGAKALRTASQPLTISPEMRKADARDLLSSLEVIVHRLPAP